MVLTKAGVVDKIYSKSFLSKREADELLESLLHIIKERLRSGEEVKIMGFGQFSIRDKAERMGRNPQTGEPMKIPSRKIVKFRPSKALKEDILERYAHRIDKNGVENPSVPPRSTPCRAINLLNPETNGQQEEQYHEDPYPEQITF